MLQLSSSRLYLEAEFGNFSFSSERPRKESADTDVTAYMSAKLSFSGSALTEMLEV